MAVFETARPVSSSAGIFGFFNATVASVVAWNEARITEKMLSGLTNRELDDIGLTRGDIAEIARRG